MPSMMPPGLVETIRVECGRVRWLEQHQARLERSWSHLLPGAAPDLQELLAKLPDRVPPGATVLVRVAFRADTDNQVGVESSVRGLSPLPEPVRVELAPVPRVEDPARCRHKVADRSWLHGLRVADADETLLWSRSGRLLEGTRSNLFLWVDGGWITPPEEDGLVPGVVRARLLGGRGGAEVEVRSLDRGRQDQVKALVLSGTGIGLTAVSFLGPRRLDAGRAEDFVTRQQTFLEDEVGPHQTGSGTMVG